MTVEVNPNIVIARRVYNRVHYNYSDNEQEIWRSLYFLNKIEYYGERVAGWTAMGILIIFIISALWRDYLQVVWLVVISLFFLYRAFVNYKFCNLYRKKLLLIVAGREDFFSEVGKTMSEARYDMDEKEPVITIDIILNPE